MYHDSIAERSSRAIHARSLIDSANLSAAEAEKLQARLEDGFEQWMRSTFAPVVVEELTGQSGKNGGAVNDVVRKEVALRGGE